MRNYIVQLNGSTSVSQKAENSKEAALAAIQTPNVKLGTFLLVSGAGVRKIFVIDTLQQELLELGENKPLPNGGFKVA